jgi:light-regulated signal transduction histidine kinase (bacteriophytochrome)
VKRPRVARSDTEFAQHRALLMALSDDLALPLLQVKTTLELLSQEDFPKTKVRDQAAIMSMTANAGLQLVEAYRLVLRSNENGLAPIEPVAIGAVLEEVAHQISPYAKQYGTEIIIDVQGKITPILAHGPSLVAALQVLSSSLIRAQAAQSEQKNYQILLGAHKSSELVATGVFSSVHGLSDKTLRAARSLTGKARQPLPAMPPGAASGVLLADMLCAAMWQPLRAAAHRNMGGLATIVPASKQLSFV